MHKPGNIVIIVLACFVVIVVIRTVVVVVRHVVVVVVDFVVAGLMGFRYRRNYLKSRKDAPESF